MDYDVFSTYYDRLTDNVQYEAIASFIEARIPKGSITVDLGCGTGRLCRILSDKGYNMIGVDRSEGMLLRAMGENSSGDILFLQQDLTQLDLYGSIRGAVCVLDTLNHLSDREEVRDVIAKTGLFMEKGGIFIFDVNTAYKHRKILADNAFVYEFEDLFCVWQNQLNEENGAVDVFLDFFVDESGDGETYIRESENFTEILITEKEIRNMLEAADFEVISVTDDYTDNPVAEKTQRMTFVAKKKVDQ